MDKEIAQLKDAINHCEEVVCQQELNGCKECAEDHLQLAVWLRELIGYKMQNSDLESVRQELLERGDETVTFRDLVERFDEVEEEYKGQPWNLKQIYNNFNILIGKKPNNADDCISREAVLEQTYKWSKDEFLRVTNPFNYLRKKINSLPSVTPEQEPYDDCISRQAAIDIIDRWLACDDYNEAERHIMRATQSVLYDLPPVKPQPKMGHWIYIGNSEINGLKICKCSNCEKKTYGSHKFCPNCNSYNGGGDNGNE